MQDCQWLIIIAIFLIAWGFFCLGQFVEGIKTAHWRAQWIFKEHKLALLEGREPEDIDGCKL
jgi:hypothetical protein